MSLQNRIVVFSRFPIAGKAKTRLIRAMGAEAAAVLQRDMSGRTILIARVAGLLCKADLVVQFTGARPRNMERWLGRGIPYITASSSDLGTSMLSGFIAAAAAGSPKTLTIGSDCPELDANILGAAFGALDTHDIVIGPASDGGYYLIGMRVPHPALFQGMQWGGINVLRDTLKAASGAALKVHLLPELSDVDLESDLPTWNRVCVPPPRKNGPPRVSVIIPTLNEAEYIEDTLRSLRKGAHEIIVVDGHSQDDTITRAQAEGATVLQHKGTRAQLLNAGALNATGDILLFLHADTLLPEGYAAHIHNALLRPGIAAGAFSFSILHPAWRYRVVEVFTNLRSHLLRLPYGDQGLFMSRARFHRLGGFADLPIMEDFELVRRLCRSGNIVTLPERALTSSRRWRKLGVLKTMMINQRLILNYALRRPPEELLRLYGREKGVSSI